ncbi:Protein FAR1-RELATED SEQUENCE 8 [Frankliniella fusca]|uniref:Protein FAR1-RELATED SEQUENCE 8 n=1 Tax=Frankliniella fusca TaxID=407009 RepID=A0AAE1I1X8_9NEOP|nr:Protein FAR1-RELATED SEQUENCE 8 [Frankliniella fusca]
MTPFRGITNQDILKVKPVVYKPQDKDLLRARLQSHQVLSALHAPEVLQSADKKTNHQNENNVKGKTKFLATIEKKSAEEHLSVECTKELGLDACVNYECNAEDSSDLSDEEFVRKPKIKPSAKVLPSLQHVQKRAATVELSAEGDEIPKKRKTPNCRLSVSEIEKLVIAAEDKSKSLMEDFKDITDTLPSLFDFIVISIERNVNDPEEWKAVLRLNISSQEEAELWIEEFEMLTKSDFRQKETRLKDSPQVVFKRLMRCQYKVPKSNYQPKKNLLGKKPMRKESKNTDCGSNLIVTVKRKEMKWSSDIFLSKFPCDIKINFYHNHFILTKDSLRHRRPSAAVTAKFHLLFEQAPSGEEMLISLEEFINKYNASQNEKCVAFQVLNGKDLMIAICTPLMKRVHTRLRSAGEVVFVDSSGTMDTHNTRVFLILCPSIAGALPLGVLMVSSEAEVVLKPAFELLLTLLPDEAFGGRGKKGPKIFMTDDCDQERNTLHSLFPEAVLLLCLFHVLNAYWRYVWKSEHHVKKDDRAPAYFSFRDVVYASDEEKFEALWNDMMNLPAVKDNACVKDHLIKFKPRAAEWALHLRNDILTRGHHTNNYAEAEMRILKDKI